MGRKDRDRDRTSDGQDDVRKHRKREKSSRKDKRSRKKREDEEDSLSAASDSEERRRSRKKRSRKDDERSSSEESDSDDSRRKKKSSKKKRRKEDKKRKKKSSKKKKKRKREDDDKSDNEEDSAQMKELSRNYDLAEALYQLLVEHPTPAMAKDTLPLVLLKLGGGTSLDLSQMPDRAAAEGIGRVLKALQPFGVGEEGSQVWKWTVPGGKSDERFLLRIVRTLLNDIGFTMAAIAKKDEKEEQGTKISADNKDKKETTGNGDSELSTIKDHTVKMLQSFQQNSKDQAASTLPGELGGLCKMLLEGESVALDGLPDPKLREALEGLFRQCGLELQEMEDESESDDDGDDTNEKGMGYGLPESPEQEQLVQQKLLSVMRACETVASAPPPTVARKGPMPMPAGYQAPEESSDDEGPAPVGVVKRKETISMQQIQHQAEMRARQLRGAVTGQEELMSSDPNTREEWMLVPGKFDFLSNIKAGNPMKSRNFNAKSKAGDEPSARAMDPKVKAEMDAIMQAHTDARGPTLVEQHRQKKKQEQEERAAGKKGQWNWSRDKDLDSGRRADKNALGQILGGASEDLKKKFQGGF